MKRKVVTAYEKEILATVSQELTAEFRGGFGYAAVNRAIPSAQIFADPAIVSTLSAQLRWSHCSERLPVKTQLSLLRAQERACEFAGGPVR
jgi:hypothetical protein